MKKQTKRVLVGKQVKEILEIPNLIEIQLNSYERFLQKGKLERGEELENIGLQSVFLSTFPIESPNGDMILQFESYSFDEPKYSEIECKEKGQTYSLPLKSTIDLIFTQTGEIRRKNLYMGDIPLMTERGTFIINGAERVVVSQIHRSPGVIFGYEEKEQMHTARIIPDRGSWLEFELEDKKELLYIRIDRKRRILATLLLRAMGFETRDEIIKLFYKTRKMRLTEDVIVDGSLNNRYTACTYFGKNQNEKLVRAGERLVPTTIDALYHAGIKEIEIIDFEAADSLNSTVIINCLDKEDFPKDPANPFKDEPSREDSITRIYTVIHPGEPTTLENAERDITTLFFDSRRYDLGDVGRYKLNKKFDYPEDITVRVLRKEDIIDTMKYLIKVYIGEGAVDNIDHLGNRRVRSVGELLMNQMKIGFARMERIAKERMSIKEADTVRPQDLISIKPITAAIKEFFGSSQLSQFMDQVNPLSELTHKRRLNALGPGGLSRERAGFEVRDVHYSHYGRMCPIETPEGPNIGLIVSLSIYAKVNEYGFLETPYRKVEKGKVTDKIVYLTAMDEEKYRIAQAGAHVDEHGHFMNPYVAARYRGEFLTVTPEEIDYIDVSPKQIISVSTALIPFLEHDDANRALMGSNMQRQAVPLVRPQAPIIGTGIERIAAVDSGVVMRAKRAGTVDYVSSTEIMIKPDDGKGVDTYKLIKYTRTNQDTCFNQKPVVKKGDRVSEGDVIADGPATDNGELALGRNVLVAFMPWMGYNYEDAILISERIIRDDLFTSVHIEEFDVEVRETKLGMESITRDIPNVSEEAFKDLDDEGIVRIGATVRPGSILVGKVTPKGETDITPEYKLLNSIFGEKAKNVKDTSLRVPHGTEGTVVDIKRLRREEGDELSPGVEEVVKVFIAKKRKLQEGDKLAGRHGNKGVVSRVLPVEDMPFLPDGTPVDVVLNPLGVPSRMNLGQILETNLGWAAQKLNMMVSTPVFESASNEEIVEFLKKAGLPENGKTILYNGLTGEPYKNEVTVGVIYMMKLAHLVDDKIHARSTGPYSLVTQQPLGGKAQFGGQRLGEMEVWALEAYGAANNLQELLTVKSDDMTGRAKIYEAIVKGENVAMSGIPESFNVLVQELRGLGLDITVYDEDGEQIPLTEKDEEIIQSTKNARMLDARV
ncbi:MAG: DNA-directed RNA polymerase subunit beta [Spirochaetota bacterium]